MNCIEHQLALTTGEAQGSKNHPASCKECTEYAADLDRLETLAQQWRNDAPSGSLQGRIRAAALDAAASAKRTPVRGAIRPKGSNRLRLAFAGASILLFAAGLLAGRSFNRARASHALADVATAMTRINNVHITWYAADYTTDNNTVPHHFDAPQEVEQQWYLRNVGWRKEGVWGSRLILRGTGPNHALTYYRYDAAQGRVHAEQELSRQWTDFSLRGILGPSFDPNSPDVAIQEKTVDPATGHAIDGYIWFDGKGASTVLYRFWVDESFNLPICVDRQEWKNLNWRTTSRYIFDYNQRLPKSLWNPATLKDEGWSLKQAGSAD